ncbi:MAG: glycerophosphodiester phosphodiesterase family protein [Eubacteriaceae bacterium]
MFKKYIENIKLIKGNLKTLVAFELIYKFVLLGIFTPILLGLFQLSINLSGFTYLTSSTLLEYLLVPSTLVILLIIIVGITFITLFEIISVIQCYHASYNNVTISLSQMFRGGLDGAKQVLNYKNWSIVIFVILIIPLTNIVAVSGYVTSIEIPEFILDFISNNYVLLILFLMIMTGLVIFAFRWGLSFQVFTLEGGGFKEARIKSLKLMKGNNFRSLISIIFWELILYGCGVILATLFSGIGILIIKLFVSQELSYATALVTVYMIIMAIFGGMNFFGVSFVFADLTTLYYDYSQKKGFAIPQYVQHKKINMNKFLAGALGVGAFIIIVANLGSYWFLKLDDYQYGKELLNRPEITAHRGNSMEAPENSLPAFEKSIEDKANWIELDVHQTKDGVVVVTHDESLKRIAGVNKNVWELTYEEIQALDVGLWFSEEYKGLKIATLEEVIKASKGKIKINIELKPTGHEKNFEKNVMKIIEENNFKDECVLASLDGDILRSVKKIDPSFQTVYIMAIAVGDIISIDFADGFSIEATFVDRELVDGIHEANKKIYAWTINTEENIEKMVEMRVDNIITDDPILAKEIIYGNAMNDGLEEIVKLFFSEWDS